MICVVLPYHLRTLAKVRKEVQIQVDGVVTQRSILDVLEAQYPMLRGTIRDQASQERRSLLRFYACGRDVSLEPPDAPLPAAVASGAEPFIIVGAMAGGQSGEGRALPKSSRPMPDMADPKELVRRGYDAISYAYRGDSLARDRGYFRWLAELTPLLRPGDAVLDLGCGCGVPVAQELAQQFAITGVDISPVQIQRARTLVPQGTFICADMAGVDFAPQSFAAIVSFYALIHLPVAEHRPLLARCFEWLQPGGALMAIVGHSAWTGTEDDWRGAPMYWSHADEATYLSWLAELGFAVEWTRFIPEGDGGHTLLLARRAE